MKTNSGLAFEFVGAPTKKLVWIDRLLRRL
jgi:hypothetical protein